MYIVKGEEYRDDRTRNPFTLRFSSLDAIFEHLKEISNDFCRNPGSEYNSFTFFWGDSRIPPRIQIRNRTSSFYPDYWIYLIEDSEKGIIYSNGRYTSGEEFWNNECKEWLKDCQVRAKHLSTHFKFAVD